MPQPSTPAAPPAPPTPPPATAPAGEFVVATPATGAEVNALRARVRELRDAIEEATDERGELAEELQPDGAGSPQPPPSVTSGIEARLKVIDERILRMEAERDAIDRAISSAPPAALAQAGTLVRPIDVVLARNNAHSEGVAAGLAGAIPGGMLLLALILLLRRRLLGRRNASAARPVAEERAIAQLTAAVEATAIEVERIGESQRYLTQLLLERPAPAAPVVAPREAARVEVNTPH